MEGRTMLLLLVGMAAAVVFVAVVLIEGARRPGYDPIYHTGSELELGEGGWIQRANFFFMGVGMFAFAIGVQRTLDSVAGAVLLGIFGVGLLVAGVFAPDPIRGFPPGARSEPSAEQTWQAKVHAVLGGPVAFLAIFGACLALAGRLQGAWRVYTLFTAAAGVSLTVWTAVAFLKDAANLGLVQRGLLAVYFSWIVALGIRLVTASPQP